MKLTVPPVFMRLPRTEKACGKSDAFYVKKDSYYFSVEVAKIRKFIILHKLFKYYVLF